MKKIFLVALLGLFVGSASAAPVFGNHEFTDWSDFEGMFEKIYLDVIQVNNNEICQRVLEWPQFVKDGEKVFTEDDCLFYSEEGKEEFTNFVKDKGERKTKMAEWVSVMEEKFAYEKQLWQQEMSLKRQLSLGAIWTDGDSGGAKPTSPIDLVVSWNEIEDIIHGEKTTHPSYKSLEESEDDEFEDWPESPESDRWLDQRGNMVVVPGEYENVEKSFAGGFEEQMKNFEYLASHSLATGEAVKDTFGVPFHGSPVPTGLGLYVDTVASVPESTDVPEQQEVKEIVPFAELEGAFSQLFEEQSAWELREAVGSGSRVNWFSEILNVVEEDTARSIDEKVDNLLQDHAEARLKDAGQQEVLPLQQWNIILDTWRDILNKWLITNQEFLELDKN